MQLSTILEYKSHGRSRTWDFIALLPCHLQLEDSSSMIFSESWGLPGELIMMPHLVLSTQSFLVSTLTNYASLYLVQPTAERGFLEQIWEHPRSSPLQKEVYWSNLENIPGSGSYLFPNPGSNYGFLISLESFHKFFDRYSPSSYSLQWILSSPNSFHTHTISCLNDSHRSNAQERDKEDTTHNSIISIKFGNVSKFSSDYRFEFQCLNKKRTGDAAWCWSGCIKHCKRQN